MDGEKIQSDCEKIIVKVSLSNNEMIKVDKTKINIVDKYKNCILDKEKTGDIPDMVENGTVIEIHYKSENKQNTIDNNDEVQENEEDNKENNNDEVQEKIEKNINSNIEEKINEQEENIEESKEKANKEKLEINEENIEQVNNMRSSNPPTGDNIIQIVNIFILLGITTCLIVKYIGRNNK